ncbi:Uncharacterised protein [Enterobacter cloacae]|nr:Uncharacterised protein [Enterobacter cloacae]
MGYRTACGQRQDDLTVQRTFGQQIEERFQCAGKRSFINRCRDDQPVSTLKLFDQGFQRRAVETGVEQIFRREIVQIPVTHFDIQSIKLFASVFQQCAGARGEAGASGQGNDAHGCSL